MHHFVVKFSKKKFALGGKGALPPPNHNPAVVPDYYSVCLCGVMSTEAARVSSVRGEGDGVDLHRGDEVVGQPADGEPRECAGQQGRRQRQRVQVFAQQVQAIQQVGYASINTIQYNTIQNL